MKRVIVDFKKLTILKMIHERYPDGHTDKDIIAFRNKNNEIIETIEVKTDDTVYLVKVGKKLTDSLEDFLNNEDDDINDVDDEKEIDDAELSIDEEDVEEEKIDDDDDDEDKDNDDPYNDDEEDDEK